MISESIYSKLIKIRQLGRQEWMFPDEDIRADFDMINSVTKESGFTQGSSLTIVGKSEKQSYFDGLIDKISPNISKNQSDISTLMDKLQGANLTVDQ